MREDDIKKVKYIEERLNETSQETHFDLFLAPDMTYTRQGLREGYRDIKEELQKISVRWPFLAPKIMNVKALLLETFRKLQSELDKRNHKPREYESFSSLDMGPPKKRFDRRKHHLPLQGKRFHLQKGRNALERQANKAALDHNSALPTGHKNGSPTAEQTICASGDLCGMPKGTPLNLNKHICQTCSLALHGCLCWVEPQTPFEQRENICYCRKCGRPEENGPPPPQKDPPPPPPPQKDPPPPPPPQKDPPPQSPPRKRYSTRKRGAKTLKSSQQDNPYAKEYNTAKPRPAKKTPETSSKPRPAKKKRGPPATNSKPPPAKKKKGRPKATAAAKAAAKASVPENNTVKARVVNEKCCNSKIRYNWYY